MKLFIKSILIISAYYKLFLKIINSFYRKLIILKLKYNKIQTVLLLISLSINIRIIKNVNI